VDEGRGRERVAVFTATLSLPHNKKRHVISIPNFRERNLLVVEYG
jgi:hypothetical protein